MKFSTRSKSWLCSVTGKKKQCLFWCPFESGRDRAPIIFVTKMQLDIARKTEYPGATVVRVSATSKAAVLTLCCTVAAEFLPCSGIRRPACKFGQARGRKRQRDRVCAAFIDRWPPFLLHRGAAGLTEEKHHCSCHPLRRQQEVDGLIISIDCPVQIFPPALVRIQVQSIRTDVPCNVYSAETSYPAGASCG